MGEGDERHKQPIRHNFAISSEDVTVEQFQRFRAEYKPNEQVAPPRTARRLRCRGMTRQRIVIG